jgi:hypothetical protein
MIILRFPRRNNRLLQAAAIVGSAANAATSERKTRDNCQHPAIPGGGDRNQGMGPSALSATRGGKSL